MTGPIPFEFMYRFPDISALVVSVERKTRKLIFLWIFDQSTPHSSFNQGNPRPNNRMQVLSSFPSNFGKSTILLPELFRYSVIVTGFISKKSVQVMENFRVLLAFNRSKSMYEFV